VRSPGITCDVRSRRWPYPPFPSREWLGGPKSGDQALVSATRCLRGLLAERGVPIDGRPEALLAGLGATAELVERLQWAMLSLVGEARSAGASWAEIGEALGVSRQAAHARFAALVAEALARAEAPATPPATPTS
jgi:hypothetical protein